MPGRNVGGRRCRNTGSSGLLVGPVLGVNPGDGAIYAAYPSTANGGSNAEIYVKRWNGVSWVEAGVGGASGAGISNSPGLDLDPSWQPIP